jgi:hypothetical protein
VNEHTQLLNSNADLRARIDRIESHAKMPAEQRAQMAAVYDRAEKLGQLHNVPIAPPMPGENLESFTARAFTPFRQFSQSWKNTDLSSLCGAGPALTNIVNDIAHDAERAIDSSPELRQVNIVDPYSGQRRITWRGDPDGKMWHQFANPLRYGNFSRPSEVPSNSPKPSYRV